jgi:hypothetical protein
MLTFLNSVCLLMNLDLYCKYARTHQIKCCLSELMVECNKHYIMTIIHDEIPNGKCMSFDVDYVTNTINITLINVNSLKKEAFVIVDLKYLYDPMLFSCSTKTNTFAYLVNKN